MSSRCHDVLERVTEVLIHVGLRSIRIPETGSLDLVASSPKGDLAVVVKTMGTLRIQDLEGRLALGVLQLHKFALRGSTPIVVVVVDRFGSKAQIAMEGFMASYAPEMGWALVGRTGGARIEISSLGVSTEIPASKVEPRTMKTSAHLFSDLNRWMLKVLLLGPDGGAHFGGPRFSRPLRTPTELHRTAEVSVEKAHGFVRTFEDAGFLRRTRHGLQVVEREALLERWFEDEKVRPTPQVPMRSVFGRDFSLQELSQRLGSREQAFGGFYAAAALGMQHASREGVHLHLRGTIISARTELDLVESRRQDAHLVLVGNRNVESVLRAAAMKDGICVVDEIQAALDVVNDPARGYEQAQFIKERLLLRWDQP